jgi:hypothetical protein
MHMHLTKLRIAGNLAIPKEFSCAKNSLFMDMLSLESSQFTCAFQQCYGIYTHVKSKNLSNCVQISKPKSKLAHIQKKKNIDRTINIYF